jgi:AraC-like DNA-binding protein
MTYLKITALASMKVSDCKNLRASWKQYGGPGSLVRIFHCPRAVHSGTDAKAQRNGPFGNARWPAGPAQVRVGGQEVYTLAEVAALTGLSRQTVTRIFEREKGVLILARSESLHKRRYRSIRIPRVVFERVLNRMTAK